jgi:hypothetical protein
MAEGVTPESSGKELEPTTGRELESAHSKELAPYTPQVSHGHETKFRFSYAILAGIGVGALAIAAIFVAAGKPPKPPAWSQWKPSASGDQALTQIASHIAPTYRQPTGEQLVAVEGGPAEVAGLPVKIVLLRTPNDFALAQGKSAVFSLCGLGKLCSIKSGKPSHERELLLQREALELALYTLRYVHDVEQVVVILPPPPKSKPSHAMFFTRGDVKSQLSQPLAATLPAKPPSIPSLKAGPVKDFLEKVTGKQIYNYDLTQAQDASVLLELARFDLKAASGSSSGSPSTGTGP